ncbi:hypothetical protein C8R47DRAFT_1068181 [Mycena vitilis]|nr:hypothetical protein C8R47DRAFT_1068181 [Mycena vitilis]
MEIAQRKRFKCQIVDKDETHRRPHRLDAAPQKKRKKPQLARLTMVITQTRTGGAKHSAIPRAAGRILENGHVARLHRAERTTSSARHLTNDAIAKRRSHKPRPHECSRARASQSSGTAPQKRIPDLAALDIDSGLRLADDARMKIVILKEKRRRNWSPKPSTTAFTPRTTSVPTPRTRVSRESSAKALLGAAACEPVIEEGDARSRSTRKLAAQDEKEMVGGLSARPARSTRGASRRTTATKSEG